MVSKLSSVFFHLYPLEEPMVNFITSQTSFYSSDNTQLVCSVTGGYPLYYNITLMKNDVFIANTIGSNQFVYSTSNDQTEHKYGLYQCIVDNTVTAFETKLLLREKGLLFLNNKFFLLLNLVNLTLKLQGSCSNWIVSNINNNVQCTYNFRILLLKSQLKEELSCHVVVI